MFRDIQRWLAKTSQELLKDASDKIRETLYDFNLELGDRKADGIAPGGKRTRMVLRRHDNDVGMFVKPLTLAWAAVINETMSLWHTTRFMIDAFNSHLMNTGAVVVAPVALAATASNAIAGLIFEDMAVSKMTYETLAAERELFEEEIAPFQTQIDAFFADGQFGPVLAERDVYEAGQRYGLQKNPLNNEFVFAADRVTQLEAQLNPDGLDKSCYMDVCSIAPAPKAIVSPHVSFRENAAAVAGVPAALVPVPAQGMHLIYT